MLTHLVNGLTALGNGPAIGYLFGGSLLGVFLGVIPGLGGAVVLSIILAFIYHINDTGTLSLFLATQAGSYFSASITSILLNTPAHPEAFAVTFDGFPMAQRGEAGRALGISASSTMVGGVVGCAVLVGFIQIINSLSTLFHPPEYVGLISIALLLVGTLGTDAVSKALISAGIGLMLSTIGSDPISGIYRYTFNAVGLYSGISLVALFLGLFAIPQMVLVFGTGTAIARQDMMGREVENATAVDLSRGFGRQVIQGVRDSFTHWITLITSGIIGVITGIIPGIGGFAANFMSYGIAQQFSKRRELFGTGIPEGIIAPEGSSLSKEAGGMVPLLGLGIPGGVGGALFLAALTIRGVKVGYGFTTNYPTLAYETVWVIALGGLIGTVAGLLAAPQLAKVTRVPGPALVPLIMGISVLGTFASEVSFFSIMEICVFSVVGFVLRRLRYSLAVFGIGLILGPQLEINIYQTHQVYPGLTFLKRPLADILFLIAILVLVAKGIQMRREHKRANAPIEEEDVLRRAEEIRRRERERHPYPVLAPIATFVILVFCGIFLAYTAIEYPFNTKLMPFIASFVAGAMALWRLPIDVAGLIDHIKTKRANAAVPAAVEVIEPVPAPVGGRELGEEIDDIDAPGELIGAMGPAPTSFAARSAAAPIKGRSWTRNGQYSRELAAFGWFGVLVASTWLFGFEVGIPAFCVVYGMTATGYVFPQLWKRAIFTVLTAAVMWTASYEILNLLHISVSPIVTF